MKASSVSIGVMGAALLLAQGLYAGAQQGKGVSYWPFKKGSTWTLTTRVQGRTLDQVVTVTDVTPGKDYSTATLEYKVNGQSVQGEKYQFGATGIARAASGAGRCQPAYAAPVCHQVPAESGRLVEVEGNHRAGRPLHSCDRGLGRHPARNP